MENFLPAYSRLPVHAATHNLCPPFCSPTVVEEPTLEIKDGRHPIIDQMMGEGEQYVPNDTRMSVRLCMHSTNQTVTCH